MVVQARAAGVRCGDGVGDAGRISIAWLKEIGAVSLAEAQRRCPGLQVRPMRPDRYRQVSSCSLISSAWRPGRSLSLTLWVMLPAAADSPVSLVGTWSTCVVGQFSYIHRLK